MTDWDVAIVGAGPAGATAAIHLARNGHKVLLIDKKSFPRDKVCGDALIPDSLACLERMGLLSKVEKEGYKLNRAVAFSPSRIEFEVLGNFVTLKRYRLDAMLVKHALDSGANFIETSVSDIEFLPSKVTLKTTNGATITAKVCLLATGARIELAQKLGLITQPKANAMAIRCYVHSDFPIDKLVFSFDHSVWPGYAWIFPLGNQEFNIGYGIFAQKNLSSNINLRESLFTFISRFPLAEELLKHGKIISPIKGAMLRCGLTGTNLATHNNLLIIGETAGTTFSFTGEGIGKAMESAEIAADVTANYLRTGDTSFLESYPDIITQKLQPKYLGYKMAEKWLNRSTWIIDFMANRVKKSKFLQESLSGIVDETFDPKTLVSVPGLIRSLFT